MSNILITGCAGFIGYHTSLKLLKNKKYVVGIDITNEKKKETINHKRLSILKSYKQFSYYKININNKRSNNPKIEI